MMASISSWTSKGTSSRVGTISSSGRTGGAGGSAVVRGGSSRHDDGRYDSHTRTAAMASASSSTRTSPRPDSEQCISAPPISSSVTRSPVTISASRGEPM